MAIEINGKVYRNIQEQVAKNQEDIDDLNHRIPAEPHFYTKEETDELLYFKADKSTTYTKEETNELLALKADKPTWHMYVASYSSVTGDSGNERQIELMLLSTYETAHEIWQNINDDLWIDDESIRYIDYNKYKIVSSYYAYTTDDDSEYILSFILSNIIAAATEDIFNISFEAIRISDSNRISTSTTVNLTKIF